MLLFSPGAGGSVEIYENLITNLVSNGYVVVGINTPFINPVALPNGHIVQPVKPKSSKDVSDKFIPMQMQDLSYVFKQLVVLRHSISIFSTMDLKHIGAFGHSVGGKTIANIVQAHPDWFQAAAILDMAEDVTHKSIQPFPIPMMLLICAYWESFSHESVQFELGRQGFLVLLSPSTQDHHYSYHMNYSDYSTLQYLPAFQTYLATKKAKQNLGSFLGKGNGWIITRNINIYLVQFFDNFLKEKPALQGGLNLSNHDHRWCGPAVLNGSLQLIKD